MKKSLLFGLSAIMLSSLLLTSCGYKEEQVDFEVKKYELVDDSEDYELKYNSLNLYYDGVVEYVDLNEFLGKLEGYIATEYVFSNINAMLGKAQYYWYTKVDENSSIIAEKVIVDYVNDTITLNNYRATSCIVQSESGSAAFEGIETKLKSSKEDLIGDSIKYDLKKYDFNVYFHGRKIYIPFVAANALYCSTYQQNIYLDYNDNKAHFVDYDLQEAKMDNIIIDEEQTEDFRKYNLNSFEFIMDNFYGLKDYKNINSFDEYISNYKELLLSTDPADNLEAYRTILLTNLNDMHTRLGNVSYYNEDRKVDNWNEEYCGTKRLHYNEVDSLLMDKYKNADLETFDKQGDTIIKYKGFHKTVSGRQYNILVVFFNYFLDDVSVRINRLLSLYSEYDYIIFDLSLNGGGYNTELFKILGTFYNSFDYNTRYIAGNSSVSYSISVPNNYNSKYSGKVSVITSECSFSCGNIMPSYVNSRLGQVTGGGMCAVIPYTLPDGTTIQLSSHNATYSPDNKPIEDGVEATTLIPYDDFFDYNKIINEYYIPSIQ